MESLMLLGFAGVLRDALKVFCKNGRIMASVALFTLLTKSILYLSITFSTKPLITDLLVERNLLHVTTPNTPEFTNILAHIRKDFKIFYGLECIYVILDAVTFLLSATATILAAAIIHGGKDDLSLKNLLLRTTRSWKRPLVTSIYTTLFGLVYLFLYAAILFGITRIIKTLIISPVTVFFLGVASVFLSVSGIVFFVYLSAIWTLAIVVSAVEEIRGIEAVIKATEISKGMNLQGISLKLLFIISSCLLSGILMMLKDPSLTLHRIVALVIINSHGLLWMYLFAAFTVFYYRCKKTHGERVELEEILDDGYSKIPTTTVTTTTALVVGDDIP
ncbi:conserved hypothetical protein [Ricinus communis]|uniref:Transmembrane protein n=1 Tax=Ricinus communis TaxID=3988 RepID=B9T4P4_RICCO|nr:conserved hypothetical protein [Ricinus communis]|eukprot:XP_025015567.1 uncharacterized protein LOC112536894 [Ricinus communis]